MIELNERERKLLMQCINFAIKASENAIELSKQLNPIADKIALDALTEQECKDKDNLQ